MKLRNIIKHVITRSPEVRQDMAEGKWDEVMTDALYAACGAETDGDVKEAKEIAKDYAAFSKPRKGDYIVIGVDAMCELHIGWTEGDAEGYDVLDYFDQFSCYLGPDRFGIEPIFREMTSEEVTEYLEQEGIEA